MLSLTILELEEPETIECNIFVYIVVVSYYIIPVINLLYFIYKNVQHFLCFGYFSLKYIFFIDTYTIFYYIT